MNTVIELLDRLANEGVRLSVEAGQLNCYAPKGALTPALRESIREHQAELIALLEGRSRREAPVHGSATEFPLSAGQKGLYILQKLYPAMSAYNVPMAFRIKGGLDVELLAAAWDAVLDQYPILKVRFLERDGALYQRLDDACRTKIRQESIELVEDAALLAFLKERAKRPFHPNEGPLTRIELFNRGGAESILMVTIHHLVIDGTSGVIVLRSLLEFYQQLSEKKPVQLARDLAGYQEFVAWEESMLASREGEVHAGYWKKQLEGELPVIELTSDRPRPLAATFEGMTLAEQLPGELSQWLRDYSKSQSIPASAIFLALFQLVLHRFTDQEDVIVGMPVMGRAGQTFLRDVGYFVNMVPLRTRCEPELKLNEFFRRVQGTMMDGLFHSSYPFPLMVEALPVQTGGGRNPVFQVMYAYQNFVTESMFAASMQRQSFEMAMIPEITQEGEFDLALEVFEDGPGFSMSLKYNPDLYQEKTIRCLFDSYFALLGGVREDHNRSLREYSIISEKERERVLVEFNDTNTPYPQDKCFHQLFAEQAALHGDRVAVMGGDERLTYRELQSRGRDLALYLQSQGVGPDGFVGLCMERSVDLIVALLGILEAGAAYVPLDPSHPNERIRFMLEDSGTAFVLTQDTLADRLVSIGGGKVRALVLDRQWEEIQAGAAAARAGGIALEERVRPENLAYVIYTSGSTGKPKGVMLEHRSLVNYLSYCVSHYVSGSEGECASFVHFPLTFDASITSLYVPLLTGKAIDLNPGGGIEAFASGEILGRGYEFIKLTPAHLMLLKNGASTQTAELLEKKNLLVVGGEALTWSHVDFLCRPGSAIEIVNEYGPTEATVGCTTFRFACGALRDGAGGRGDISIGAPIANMQIHVLDRNRNLQPIGVPGELYIAGAGLARGYLNRPDLTEESFVPNPFQPGTRMYKSGDWGRWREDGTLQYLGRVDMQTKIRGYRIEPGEIEVRMMEHEGVQDALVMTREDTPGEKRLVAYFTPSPEHAPSVVRYLRLRKTKAGAAASHFTLPNGLVIFDQNQAETDSHYDEIFGGDDSLLQHGVTLNDGDCVFDVGADIGMFSLFVDQHCRDAAIYAFEPIPKVFASLQLNAALYDWNGRLYQHGLGETPGQRVSDIIRENEIQRIDLLKIGVECASVDVLRGIQAEDWPKIRQIVVDIDDVSGRRTEVMGLLEAHGYQVSHAQSRSLDSAALYNVYAVRRTAAGSNGGGSERPAVAEPIWNSPDILVRDLRAFLLERLPEYMVPSAFVPLDAMPLSAHGKLDRKALPAPEGGPFALRTYEPPRGEVETALAAIWRDILKIERVGRNDNFFELGGHSLLATQVVSRIQMQMGLDIPLKTVFEVTNFAQQAACLEKAEQSRIPPIVPVDRSKFERLPMSFAEERVWFIHQLVPEGAAVYSSPGAFIVRGDLDVDRMNEAYNLIIARHESLRTVFPIDEDGLAHRVILDHLDFKFRFVDLSEYDQNLRDARVQDLCIAEARTPFDLTAGPLMRGLVFKIAEQVHIVMINLHHIISDGWSIGVLAREFRTIMEALRTGRPPELPTLPIQYADYAIWQRQWLEQGGLQQKQLAYWKRQLTGLPESLDLPTDFPRPRVIGFKGATLQFEMNAQLVGELRRLGERHGATLYMVLLAAYNALLHRLTDRSDICVGGLIANRNHVATEHLIGMFVNTLALRSRVEGEDTVHELLSRVKGTCLEAYENQDAPFPAVVEMMNLRVNPSVSPFFQTLFFLQTAGYDELDYGTQRYFMDTGYAKYDISVELVETAAGLSGGFEFNTDLFKAETITRVMEHFVAICRGMVNNPAARVRDLDYVSEAEKSRLLVEFNPARSEVPSLCLHELFTEQVAQYSDKPAIVWGSERLTYRQLDERSADLALYLQSLGVQPDSLVGLCMERSPDLVVGLLGILRAGGAYVPLDPNYPDKRLAYMVRDSQARIVLTQDSLSEKLRDLVSTETQLVSLDGGAAEITRRVGALKAGGASLRRDVEPHHLAYLIYTSGSTGRPKGVAIEHHSPVNLVHWARGVYSREELAGVMASTSVCFDLSIFEMFVPLASGGTIILVPNALGLLDLPNRGSVTLINTVPSAMEELVRLSAVPESVQTVNLAGEPLSPRLVDKIYDTTPVRKVYDLYGPSETTTYSTFVLRAKNGPQTIGRPIANTQVYILDAHQQLQPIGVPGELYIGGDGVTRGYLNRPDLTDERFVANPFEPGTRMYKTGDRARWMDDGTLQYLGRIDTQVKVRGFRIELGEIEARLNECRGILESAVVAQGEGAEKRLIAFYRAKETTADRIVEVPQDELRTLLTRTLPDYMVPSAFVSVAAIPLNANGKVDRQTLAQIDVKATSDREYVAPRNALETELAAIYAEVLGLPPESVGINDSFFELGGHSLFAVQLHSRINTRLKRSLPLLDIFTKKTIAELVVSVEAAKPSEIPPIRPADRSQIERFPLSFAEERIWFMSQLVGDDAILYSVPGAFVIRGGKDLSRLDEALNLIIGRHEILRTVFPSHEGQAYQRILDHLPFRLERIDLSTLESREERDRRAKEICQADALAPFDLATGPLIRGKVIRLSEDEHILMLNMHHIISDGWSLGVLVKELTLIMDAFEQGKRPELAPLPIQYADYSVWQRRWLEESGVLDRQLAYWQQKLAGIPESLDLATDFPRPSMQRYVGARHTFTLDAQLTAQLKRLAEREGGTLFMVLLAVFKALLHRYTGQEDICVGSPIANRQYPETEELIGMFVNTLALRSRVAEDEPFVELLARVTETCLEAYENQNAPFEKVVDIAHPQRNLAISPLFQVVLLLQNIEMGLAHPLIQPYPLESGISKFDLTLEFTESADGLNGSLEYNSDLFRPGTVARMAGHFQALCQAVTAAPETRVRDLSYMQDSERQQLLVAFNDTQADYPKDKCIHQLFTERVAIDPEKTAVVFGSHALSYRELHEASGDLALWLQGQGVWPDRIVGLCLERSVEMMVGIMGAEMAGGGYLPLDPVYPDERLKYMLQDSEPPVVLTQERFRERITALASPDTKVIALDTQGAEIARSVAALKSGNMVLRNDVRARHLSYVIYTSGSTGNPKGVMVEHQALVNRIVWMQKRYHLSPEDVVLQKTPYSFDVSVWEFFWPVIAGASVVFAAPEGHKDVQYLGNLINESKVTTLHFVPSMLNAFLNNAQAVCPGVRQIFCSGEALDRKAVDTYRTRFPHAALHNLYGPTEAAIDVTAYDCTQLADAVVPIGSPISNIQIYILDRHNRPQPIGVPGELHIAGDGLARGYLNRPELTRDRFVPNPFQPGTRMYKTGDLARWRNDGTIEYLGRNDFQVKLRGFRIELGEIEARLMEHEGVQEAVVLAREDSPGDKRLVAYFTPSMDHASPVGRFLRIRKTDAGAAAKYYTLPNGSLVFHQNLSETEFLYDEIFNEDVYLKHGLTLNDGDCIFDVGANIGLFSLFVTQRCRNATVYAFEPIPTVFESLQLNAMLHGWGGRVYQCGLAETSRQETFTFYPHNTVISSSMTSREEARQIVKSYMLKQQEGSGATDAQALADTDNVLDARLDTEEFACELRPVSDIIRENQIERIDLLKIDVEKAELDVLKGIRDDDWPKIRQLVVEVHDVSGRLAEIVGMLEGLGYEVGHDQNELLESAGLYNLYAVRRTESRVSAGESPAPRHNVTEKVWSSPEFLIRDIRAFLGERLPEYMLPSAYVPLDRMPLTSNGKLDRKALPAPEAGAFALRAYEPPQGEIEVALAAIWSDILKIERVGRNDDFFELGGHSLSAVQLISRISTKLNRSLSLLDIFTKKTIAELAAAVDAAKVSEIPPIEPVDHARIERFPLSFAEERIWFMSQLVGEDAILYSVPGAFVIRGGKDLSRLDEALNLIIDRHEILRTVFPSHEGQAYQRILDHLPFRLERIDLSTLESREERDRRAKEICQADALAPFDLATGPLIRGKVIRLSEDEHILMLNMHHIISDGWSLGVLVKELTLIMDAFEQGKRPELAPLPIQYADYSVWQRRWLEESGVLDRQLAYWQQKLAGVPESLDLATDFPRPSMQRYVGARHAFTLDAQSTAQLKRLAEREGGTLFMVLLAVFKALLHRYTGQEDICVGSPIANRQYPETEELIGMFVNTLALRSRVAEDEPFVELLARVTETCLEAYENQNAPFEKVVDIAHPQRNLAISPLFQVVLLLQNIEMGPAHPLIQPYPLESGISKFDLTLEFIENADGLSGSLEYNSDLFRPGTVARMAGHFQALCQAVTAAPETTVRDLSYMQDSERQQLLVAFNDTRADYPKDKCIHQLFTERVAIDPEKTAVVFGSRALSYRELHETSSDLALWLQAQGVEPDRIVGLCLERSMEMMVGIIGTALAGGAYLPLDPVYPDERLKFMLQDSEPPVVLTQERFRERITALASPDAKVIALDAQWAEIEQSVAALKSGNAVLRKDVRPGHLSYVIYTSGSTGNPKGVMVEHQALVNRIVWMQKRYHLSPEDVVLQKTPYSFDVSVWEFFWPVMAGASVVFAAPEGHKDVQYLGNLINESKVTTLHFVPSMLNAFLSNAQAVCPGVRQIFCSGEALDRKAVDAYRTRFPNAALHNLYGPTEAAIDVTAYDCTQLADAVVPIGSPISNIQIYILDRHDHPQPIGVPGELHIAGDGLARGYLNRPELTRDKFVSNPFRPGARMYKTGDLARWRNDGAVEYLGRNDFQVKVRGFRIELGEIEARLMEHDGVQEAVVLAREDTPGEKRLVAYFTPSPEHAPAIGRFLRIRKTAAGAAAKYYTLPNGALVFHQNQSETEFLYDEIFNEDVYLKHGLTLNDGDCIFDVGANIGLFSLFVTQRCRNATVYAFEPIPKVFESLQLNAMLHGWAGRVYQCGLAETSRQQTFTFYPHNTVISSSMTSREEAREIVRSYMLKRQSSSGTGDQARADTDEVLEARLDTEDYTCELRPISDVIRENAIERIDLLKIDVEKAELDVLRGIRDEDWPKIRQLVVEVHDVSGRLAEIVGMLEGLGYQVGYDQNELLESTGLYNLYAVRLTESRLPAGERPAPKHDVAETVWRSPESLIRDLRAFLGERLPEYMLPSAYVPLAEMPLTSNGKLDRKALPAPEAGAFALRAYEPPQGDIEEALAAIWSEALKIERVGRNDDFFELGGHSLSAVQLMSRINKRFLRSLPLLVIFKSPSVAAFAKLLSGEETASFDIVVPIQTGGEAPPLFGIPGAGATVLSLLPIAKALGAKQPFYGLQAVGLDGATSPLTSVEQTAQVNVAALKKVRAEGPYSLIGHSYGGVVAYEMARILLEQGEEVASLTLLDSIAPWVVQEQYGPALLAETDRAFVNPDDDNAKLQMERLAPLLNDIDQEIDPAQFAAAREVYLANLACYAAYKPSMLPKAIDISLYRAAQESARSPALPDDYGWNRLLQRPIRIFDVDGDHYSMLKNLQLLEMGAPALVN